MAKKRYELSNGECFIFIDKYTRTRYGKKERVRFHSRTIQAPTLSEKTRYEIEKGKAKKLLEGYDKDFIGYIESHMEHEGKKPRIPLWVYKFKHKHEVLEIYRRKKRFPTAKERIQICVHENWYYYDLKELAKDSAIPYKNLGRYLNELEREGKIEITKYKNNSKKVEKLEDWKKSHDNWLELMGFEK